MKIFSFFAVLALLSTSAIAGPVGTTFEIDSSRMAGTCNDGTRELSNFYVLSDGTVICPPSWNEGALPSASLLQRSDITYLGAFRTPQGIFGESEFAYSKGALEYNPDNNSLFAVGHDTQNGIAEISIPSLVSDTSNLSNLNTASILQNFRRVLGDGTNSAGETIDIVGGMRYEGGKLYVNGYNFYNATGDYLDTTIVIDDATDIANSSISGYYRLNGAAHAAGHISPIPTGLQAELGGTHISGLNGVNIVSRTSAGPSGFVWNLADIATANTLDTISSTTVLDYPFDPVTRRLHDDPFNQTLSNDLWTWESRASYGFIPEGFRTYAHFGWSGGHTSEIVYKGTQIGATEECPGYCALDPNDSYNYYWFYDVDDLVAVRNGSVDSWTPRPYAYGEFVVPFRTSTRQEIGGGAYDAANSRLFLALSYVDSNNPIILVYQLGSNQ